MVTWREERGVQGVQVVQGVQGVQCSRSFSLFPPETTFPWDKFEGDAALQLFKENHFPFFPALNWPFRCFWQRGDFNT